MVKRVIPGVLMSLMSQSLLVWHLLKAQLVLRVFEIYGHVSHCQAVVQFLKKKEFLKLQGKGKTRIYTMSGHGAMGHHLYYLFSSSLEDKCLYL